MNWEKFQKSMNWIEINSKPIQNLFLRRFQIVKKLFIIILHYVHLFNIFYIHLLLLLWLTNHTCAFTHMLMYNSTYTYTCAMTIYFLFFSYLYGLTLFLSFCNFWHTIVIHMFISWDFPFNGMTGFFCIGLNDWIFPSILSSIFPTKPIG